jgi:signal transduction histidine kinase
MRERVPSSIDAAKQQVGRLTRLADDLQVISTRVNDFRVEPEAFDLVAATKAAAQRVEALDPGRPLTLDAPATPVMVRADPARLDQIFDNLLKNAMVYSSRESAIEISAAAEGGHATIRVRDHGPGVGAADRERIFERFTRGAAAADQPGMGIGLYVSRAIATRMGGRLFVEESSADGSVFTVELPLAESSDADGDGDRAVRSGEGIGVKDRREELDAVDEARTGTAEERGAVDPEDARAVD